MSTLPKGPRGRLLAANAYWRQGDAFFTSCIRRYGDPFLMKTLQSDVVVTARPEGIAAILGADPATFDPFERDSLLPVNGPRSILALTGDALKRERKLLSRPMSAERVAAYAERVQEATLRQLARHHAPDRPFSMLELAEGLSLEVLARSSFGWTDGARIDAFDAAVRELRHSTRIPSLPAWLWRSATGWSPVGRWARAKRVARFERALAGLDALIRNEIASRRSAAQERETGDILSDLMASRYDDGSAPDDDTLRDHLVTLTLAGRETTATTIAWAFHRLFRSPAALARLLEEIDGLEPHPDPQTLERLPYLGAVCNEVLRLHPGVAWIARRLNREFPLLGYDLPPGLSVSASVTLAHRREDVFPEPHLFRPERFLERTYSAFEFFPFGRGIRRCPGAALASLELKIVLTTLLRRHRFRLVHDEDERAVRRHTTMSPRRGVQMWITQEGRQFG